MDDRQDRIDRYIRGQMNNGARLEFETEMASDPTLRKEVDETRRLIRVLGEVATCRESFARWEEQHSRERRRVAASPGRNRLVLTVISVAAAACVVVGLFLTFPSNHSSDDESYSSDEMSFLASAPHGSPQPGYCDAAPRDAYDYDDDLYADNVTTPATESYDDSVCTDTCDTRFPDYEERWSEIVRLVKCDSVDKALPMLVRFVSEEGRHRQEARNLLSKLKRVKSAGQEHHED